ncbi:sugar ABC transporter ATP-binding protein [Trebonia kvetii]|uniref:Sugar ABC transporter ATP-binding protein n=1 Tax=Trebonia kvetii TaxID=2480626 RepID=A0A6P2BVF7_9ACTN|nr:sugar ABC transporter ATP-binding protein [Trebonia kvetii]TVZ02677.1 sugar ABC transporter ATP-binding protein [Trebonia kvetii]
MTSSGPPDPGPGSTVLVEVTGVDKRFGTTRALRGVGLSLRAGQCLGLVGRNGAGKSTLVSILSGLIEPDAGTVRFGGEPAPRVGDIARWREWIATVFQHSMIVPDLSVAENVFLGNTSSVVSWRELRARTRAIMREWGFDIDARTPCRELSVEQLQIVEIARALARGAKCVLLDEPTAALERQAARRLFDRVRQLTAGGVAVLYISHHLEEVFEICENVAVLRDGELVLTAPTASLDRDDLVAAMVGGVHRAGEHRAGEPAAGDAGRPGQAPDLEAAPVVLSVDGLESGSARGRLGGVSLSVHAGEVVGVTGLLSAGVATLGRAVAGAEGYAAGQILLHGRRVPAGGRAAAQHAGIGYIPEDRRAEGFVAHLGVAENVTMTIAGDLSGRTGVLRPARRAAAAAPLTARLSLVSAGPRQPAGELSGGNQQKVTVARTLAHRPSLIVAITPTRGVDVASKELLLGSLADVAASTGAGVLLCSDELSDLAVCDRVVVLVRGEVFTEFSKPPFDRDELILATEGMKGTATNGPVGDPASVPAEEAAQ